MRLAPQLGAFVLSFWWSALRSHHGLFSLLKGYDQRLVWAGLAGFRHFTYWTAIFAIRTRLHR